MLILHSVYGRRNAKSHMGIKYMRIPIINTKLQTTAIAYQFSLIGIQFVNI